MLGCRWAYGQHIIYKNGKEWYNPCTARSYGGVRRSLGTEAYPVRGGLFVLVRGGNAMFERERNEAMHTCPQCGRELRVERDLLVCAEHGNFFVYGPGLLVRAPQRAKRERSTTMPWEMSLKTTRSS